MEILPDLVRRFTFRIKPEISSVKICQNAEIVFLEIVFENDNREQLIKRENLGFIMEDEYEFTFHPKNFISENVSRYLALDDYSLINVSDCLFTVSGIDEMLKNHKLG